MLALAVGLPALLLPLGARANGAFPASGQILLDPTDASRMWVSTSYGFAKSMDGGATFTLVCEAAIGYGGGFHPHAAVSQTGALFMGLSDGLAIGRGDTCAFERASSLEGSYVIDVSLDPSTGRAVALVQPPNGAAPYVAASEDDLVSFAKLGVDLPEKLTALTLDAAPADPSVIYVSGILDANPPRGVVITSVDGGGVWQSATVPGSDPRTAPFIAAVDPDDAGKLYVRLNGSPGRLLASDDFAQTFETVLTTTGFLHAFKLAPDGKSAYFGGSVAGLNLLDTTTLEETALAEIAARCVALDGERVFACGDDAADGFTAGVSLDGGVTFEPVLRQACIEGVLACGAGAPVEELCAPSWPATAELLGVVDCSPGNGGGGGASTGGSSPGGAPAGAAGGSGGAGAPADGEGCGACSTSGESRDGSVWVLGLFVVAYGRRSRSSPRQLHRPEGGR